jgi:hypothetical protein
MEDGGRVELAFASCWSDDQRDGEEKLEAKGAVGGAGGGMACAAHNGTRLGLGLRSALSCHVLFSERIP